MGMGIVRNGVILLVYLLIIFSLYIFISSPFEDVMTGFDNVNGTLSDSQVEGGTSNIRFVFNMIFAGLVVVPVVYFVIWCFSREPDWGFEP